MPNERTPTSAGDKPPISTTERFVAYVDKIVNNYPSNSGGDTRSGEFTAGPNKTLVAEVINFSSTLGPEFSEILDDIYALTIRDGDGNENNSLTIGTLGLAVETRDGKTLDYTDLTKETTDALVASFIALNNINIVDA